MHYMTSSNVQGLRERIDGATKAPLRAIEEKAEPLKVKCLCTEQTHVWNLVRAIYGTQKQHHFVE